MHDVFLYASVFLCGVMALSLYRAVFGPTVLDRLIGVNAIGSKTTALLILIGLIYDRVDMFVDIAQATSIGELDKLFGGQTDEMRAMISILAAAMISRAVAGTQEPWLSTVS